MKALPKGYEASKETVEVTLDGRDFVVANVLKGGIMKQSTVYIAVGEKWHEVDILNLGADDSNLQNFKAFVEQMNLKPWDLGLEPAPSKEPAMPVVLGHEQFEKIAAELGENINYLHVSKLYDYLKSDGTPSDFNSLRDHARSADKSGQTIDQYILRLNQMKQNILNDKHPLSGMAGDPANDAQPEQSLKEVMEARYRQIEAVGYTRGEHAFTMGAFKIDKRTVVEMGPEQWAEYAKNLKPQMPKSEFSARVEQLTAMGYVFTSDQFGDAYVYTYPQSGSKSTIGVQTIQTKNAADWTRLVTDLAAAQQGQRPSAETLKILITDIFLKSDSVEAAVAFIHSDPRMQGDERAKATNYAYAEFDKMTNKTESMKPEENPQPENVQAQPETAAAPKTEKPPVSLEVIGNLPPARIKNLIEIQNETTSLLEAHPVVTIVDKKTRDAVKESAAIMLKASTAIDGKEGVKAQKNRFLKNLSQTIDTVLDAEAKKRRDRLEALRLAGETYDNAEALKEQQAQRDKLQKINDRTDLLFANGFAFNGELYHIGTKYVTPTQIETDDDETFQNHVNEGAAIKAENDRTANAAVDALAAARTALIAAGVDLSTIPGMPEYEAAQAAKAAPVAQNGTAAATFEPLPAADNTLKTSAPVTEPEKQTATEAPTTQAQQPAQAAPQQKTAPAVVYVPADPENELLMALDTKNMANLENAGYIKCRQYYIQGLHDLGNAITAVLDNGGKGVDVRNCIAKAMK